MPYTRDHAPWMRKLTPLMILGLGAIYAALTTLRVHLYVTLLLLFLSAGPLSYLVFREEHE